MTILCGDSTLTGYTVAGPSGLDGAYLAPIPFIATSSGVITSLNCYLKPTNAQAFVMGLYDGVLQRLVYSPPVTVQPSAILGAVGHVLLADFNHVRHDLHSLPSA